MTCSLRPRNLATYCFISVRLYLLTVYDKNNFTEIVRTPSTGRIHAVASTFSEKSDIRNKEIVHIPYK